MAIPTPQDLNPELRGLSKPKLSPAIFAKPDDVKPTGPVLHLAAVLNYIMLEMEQEHSPTEIGGILLPANYKKEWSPYVVAKVLSVGPDVRHVKLADNVLVARGQVDQIVHDNRSYWRTTEVAVIGIVNP